MTASSLSKPAQANRSAEQQPKRTEAEKARRVRFARLRALAWVTGIVLSLAIYNASGARIFEYPMTPDRVLAALPD